MSREDMYSELSTIIIEREQLREKKRAAVAAFNETISEYDTRITTLARKLAAEDPQMELNA